MKYISIIVLTVVLALSLSVCQSVKTEKEEPFTVKLDSPKINLGTIEVQFDKMMGIAGIQQETVTIDYYPLEDAVCLQYRINFMTYYLFFDREGRAAYFKALEQYKEDYANRVLKSSGNRNTRRKYGRVQTYLIWQAAAFMKRSMASMYTEIGYDIKSVSKNKASFFVLYQREAEYVDKITNKEIRNTQSLLIYLTRAKADELAELFNQELLKSVVPETIKKKAEPLIVDTIDAY